MKKDKRVVVRVMQDGTIVYPSDKVRLIDHRGRPWPGEGMVTDASQWKPDEGITFTAELRQSEPPYKASFEDAPHRVHEKHVNQMAMHAYEGACPVCAFLEAVDADNAEAALDALVTDLTELADKFDATGDQLRTSRDDYMRSQGTALVASGLEVRDLIAKHTSGARP